MKITLNILLFLFLTSCSSQVYLEDGNFNLEKINLSSFNAKEFYSKSLIAEWSDYHKKRKNNVSPIYFFQTDTDTIDGGGNSFRIDTPYAVTYMQSGRAGGNTWEKDYCLATYSSLKFDELNAVTDLNNNTILVCAYAEESKKTDIKNIIKGLNNKYGAFKLSESSAGFTTSSVRKWDAGDVIISMVSDVIVDFKNVILTEKEKEEIAKIESEKMSSVYLFFTKKEYYNKIKEMDTRIGFLTSFED